MVKTIAIQKIEKLDILASIQNSRGIRWYSVVTHQNNLKTQNVRTIKSWKKPQRYRRQKSQTCLLASIQNSRGNRSCIVGCLGVFPLKKRGNGPYRVDSSSFKSKVGDCQGTKIMEKTIAIQKIEKLDILASIQNSRGIRWYSVVTHQNNLKTQNVRTIKSWKKPQRYRRQKSQTSWHQYKTAGEIGRALLVVHQLSLLHEWPI